MVVCNIAAVLQNRSWCGILVVDNISLVEGKDVCCYTLEKKECTLYKYVPEHSRCQSSSEVPEQL